MGGFNSRMAPTFPQKQMIRVSNITGCVLGKELVTRCGNRGAWRYNDAETIATRKFLQVAISYIPMAKEDGADLSNAAFMLIQPGREFVIISGNGDWEFYFSEDQLGEITGKCVRKPWFQYLWDKGKSAVIRIVSLAGGAAVKMIGWR